MIETKGQQSGRRSKRRTRTRRTRRRKKNKKNNKKKNKKKEIVTSNNNNIETLRGKKRAKLKGEKKGREGFDKLLRVEGIQLTSLMGGTVRGKGGVKELREDYVEGEGGIFSLWG